MSRFVRWLRGNDQGLVNSIPWKKILKGTENLNASYLIGKGSFGEVYRCNLRRNKVVAAKVKNLYNLNGGIELETEVRALNAANHPNVIKLVGKCEEDENLALVVEFMPRGSLDNHLNPQPSPDPSQSQQPQVLDWATRMKIAEGVADALAYLHDRLNIIHRDIKAANVLLDNDFKPKLADFGLAVGVFVGKNGFERQRRVNRSQGTKGCMAPETRWFGWVSTKSDVYSYAVFLIHLFTGNLPYDAQRHPESKNLADWLKRVWGREGYEREIVDVALGNMYSVQGLKEIFRTVKMCLDPQPFARPHMHYVLTLVRRAAAYPVQVNSPVTERRSIARLQSYDRLDECLPFVKASSF